MKNNQNNYTYKEENSLFTVAINSSIGDREDQQDSADCYLGYDEGIIVICDGMGGHRGGKIASQYATDAFVSGYRNYFPCSNIPELFADLVDSTDKMINSFRDDDGEKMNAGTTVVSVIITKEGLFWTYAGDSRVYIKREDELIQITEDQTYSCYLDKQLENGGISLDYYNDEISKGAALVNFLGMGTIEEAFVNEEPLMLKKNDLIIMMTDGLYRALSNDSIKSILDNFSNPYDAVIALENKAMRECEKNKLVRDNTTVAVIKIH